MEAELDTLIHRLKTDPQQREWLDAAQAEPLDEIERANLREIRRQWRNANALPEWLVEAKTLAGNRCEHAWRTQRPANDWKGFLGNWREVVRLAREEAQFLSDDTSLSRYDALVDRHEPGMRSAELDRIFGDLGQWLPALIARVKPGYIRVAADEVTYPVHVILRYEIERPLIEGELEPEDVPAAWDERMHSMLGVDTRGNYKDGCMQDVHWSEGLVGYFPCYTLGAMYAAQWFGAMRRAAPDLDRRIASGDTGWAFDWLKANVWSHGSHLETPELVRRGSGEPLNPGHFRKHLETRYLA